MLSAFLGILTLASASADSKGATDLTELLIGKWEGTRHVSEYLPNHTRVMDDVSLDPPRTWSLKGRMLSETDPESGTIIYRIVFIDKTYMILESEGRKYTLKRVSP